MVLLDFGNNSTTVQPINLTTKRRYFKVNRQ